ncbi:MAG: amidohydrolase family protein [Niastella sp.]|nr:amidohydrolase family protein [Niastella sp.]
MRYRKFIADHLFTGSQLLDGQVLITDEKGRTEAIIPAAEAGDEVQPLSGIITPGFINAHCHLELSHLKDVIAPGTGMIDFLLGVMGRRFVAEEQVLPAIDAAETAMLQNGIVAVGDICNTPHTIPQKQRQRLYYHNFIEATGFVAATAQARFDAAVATWEQFQAAGEAITGRNSIVPHAPYSVSAALFELITGFPGNHLLTMHNQESVAEDEFFRTRQGDFNRLFEALGINISSLPDFRTFGPSDAQIGKSSLQTCLPRFRAGQSLLLVHDVMTSEEDLQFVQQARQALPDCYWCLCPNANLYIGNGLPDVELLRRHGATIALGTDSLASNHQLSILAEINTLRQHYPALPLAELLQWATLNGAKALNIEEQFGSFEKGKTPGVLLLKNDLSEVKRLI